MEKRSGERRCAEVNVKEERGKTAVIYERPQWNLERAERNERMLDERKEFSKI